MLWKQSLGWRHDEEIGEKYDQTNGPFRHLICKGRGTPMFGNNFKHRKDSYGMRGGFGREGKDGGKRRGGDAVMKDKGTAKRKNEGLPADRRDKVFRE